MIIDDDDNDENGWFIWMIIDMYFVYIMMIMDGSGCHGARQESGLNQLNNRQEHIHEPK